VFGDVAVASIRPRDVAAFVDDQLGTFAAGTVDVHVKRNRWRIVMATAGHRSMQTTKQYSTWPVSCSATTRTRSPGGCSGYQKRVPDSRKRLR